jgi:hypothetical protein
MIVAQLVSVRRAAAAKSGAVLSGVGRATGKLRESDRSEGKEENRLRAARL